MISGRNLGKSLKGEHGITLKDILALDDWQGRALVFGGLVRVFTAAQIARFLWNGDLSAAEKGLSRLLHLDKSIGVIKGYKLPKSLGGVSTDVYYVSEFGSRWLAGRHPQLDRRVRTGRPDGKMRGRTTHELLLAESFVRLWAQVDIQDFLPDEELRRRLMEERKRRKKISNAVVTNEVIGDCVVVSGSAEGERWTEYEVAVRYSPAQITAKPEGMTWITCSSSQADTIEHIVGRRPIIITSVTSVAPADQDHPVHLSSDFEPKNQLDTRVLVAIGELGGAATAEGIAAITATDRGNVARVLNRLAAHGALAHSTASFEPGCNRGRSQAIFALPLAPIANYQNKLRALIRSEVAQLMLEIGYRLSTHTADPEALLFTHDAKPPLLLLIDDQRLTADEMIGRIKGALVLAAHPANNAYCAAGSTLRVAALKAAGLQRLQVNVINVHASRLKRLQKRQEIASIPAYTTPQSHVAAAAI